MWKTVPEHPKYQVSDKGGFRKNGEPGGVWDSSNGYQTVSIDGRSYLLHRVILTTFIGPPEPGWYGRHLNDDKQDNRLENLAWGTPADNANDMVRNGNHQARRRDHCKRGHLLETNPSDPRYRYCRTCRNDWRVRNGKSIPGVKGAQKLTWEKVRAMRAEHEDGKRGEYARLARKYDISKTQARNILKGEQWVE